MLLVGTFLGVADNSGALKLKCVRILGCSSCNHTNVGDYIVVVVKTCRNNRAAKSKTVYRSILVRQRSRTLRKNGFMISFLENKVVLFKPKKDEPLATRVMGSVLQELRFKKATKVLMLAWNVI